MASTRDLLTLWGRMSPEQQAWWLLSMEQSIEGARPDAVSSAGAAAVCLRGTFETNRECMTALFLDRRHGVIDVWTMSVGSERFTLAEPGPLLRRALGYKRSVGAIILSHNHPSGDPEPSNQDWDITRFLSRSCAHLRIDLLDHLVFGSADNWVSMRERDPDTFTRREAVDVAAYVP